MLIVLDLETTGLSPKEDAIIEVALVKYDIQTRKELGRIHSFINPGREIPSLISQITNIFDSDVENAPNFSSLQDELQDFIEGIPLVGHNISFDISFLESHGIDTSKNPKIDTFFLANFICFREKSLNLGYLCEVFGIPLSSAHRAIDDTIATGKLFFRLCDEIHAFSNNKKRFLGYFLSQTLDAGIRVLYKEILQLKSFDFTQEELFTYFKENLQCKNENVFQTLQTGDSLDFKNIIERIDGFEPRESQNIMIDKVDKTFSHGKKTIIEAPTGIGKTFAYLIPAIKHSLSFGERVFISTSTKALQDQIFFKDLVFLQKHFPVDFSYTKLKGKRNYLSIKLFLEFLDSKNYFEAKEIGFILKIFFWSIQTEYGELDELDYYGEEYSLLSEIHAGNPFVFDDSNPYKDIEFAVKARNRSKKSNIIITNNHILFADALSDGAILGDIKNLVIDEAHAVEDVVTGALKQSFSYDTLVKTLTKIEKKLIQEKYDTLSFAHLKQQILFDGAELFSIFEGKIFEKNNHNSKYKNLLIEDNGIFNEDKADILSNKIIEGIQEFSHFFGEKNNFLKKISAELSVLNNFQDMLKKSILKPDFTKDIVFLSHDDTYGTKIHTTVLSPGAFLKEYFWDKLESVVLTSATLSMNESFDYIKNILAAKSFDAYRLESSFDYEKQALLCLPTDLGNIKNNSDELIEFLGRFFSCVKGRTLVLFTAFSMIRNVYSALKMQLEHEGITLLAQSVSGSKHKQIENFIKKSDSSILIGTDSFWEGIDIPGDDLQYLVIHKIPFPVPTDPIFIARSRLFKNAFEDYSIPKSIIKLKQGFGRLIRTKKDSGVVIFLDDRIHTSSWGKNFFEAFPKDIKIRYMSQEKLLDIIAKAH